MDLRTQYQLDAQVRAGGTFGWLLTTVVHASSIPVNLLGYLAWVVQNDQSVYLPVRLGEQSTGGGSIVEARVLTVIQPEVVYWRAYASSSKDPKAAEWRRVDWAAPDGSLPLHTPGDPPGVLTFPVPLMTKETLRVDIRVKARNFDGLSELEFLVGN